MTRQHLWYIKNKEKYLAALKVRQHSLRRFIQALKIRCVRCGYDKCKRALDFHHRGGKIANISRLPYMGWSREHILTEIKKCRVLCSNCHRELFYKKRTRIVRPTKRGE